MKNIGIILMGIGGLMLSAIALGWFGISFFQKGYIGEPWLVWIFFVVFGFLLFSGSEPKHERDKQPRRSAESDWADTATEWGKKIFSRVGILIFIIIILFGSLFLTRWFIWSWWIMTLSPSLFWWWHKANFQQIVRQPMTYILFIPWLVYFLLIVVMGITPQFAV